MSKRYETALGQIRAILAARTQAQPILEAQEVWEMLDVWPIPSVRTVRRFMEQVRDEFGRHGQLQQAGRDGQHYAAMPDNVTP